MTKLIVTKNIWCCIFQDAHAKAADAKRKRDRLFKWMQRCMSRLPYVISFCMGNILSGQCSPASKSPDSCYCQYNQQLKLCPTAAAPLSFPSFSSSNWTSGHRYIFQHPCISTVHICRLKSGFILRLYIYVQVLF